MEPFEKLKILWKEGYKKQILQIIYKQIFGLCLLIGAYYLLWDDLSASGLCGLFLMNWAINIHNSK
jgi:hypothetical protein